MAYRSERFPAGELKGLKKTWQTIDDLEESGLPVKSEIMSGRSYRRQLAPETVADIGNVNYVLQVVFSVPKRDDGKRIAAGYFIKESRKILGEIDIPGQVTLDEGRLDGFDRKSANLAFGSTGRTEDDILTVYPPWVSSRWEEMGRSCMFYCGIEPPQPQLPLEEYPVRWGEYVMRRGGVVFEPTPTNPRSHQTQREN